MTRNGMTNAEWRLRGEAGYGPGRVVRTGSKRDRNITGTRAAESYPQMVNRTHFHTKIIRFAVSATNREDRVPLVGTGCPHLTFENHCIGNMVTLRKLQFIILLFLIRYFCAILKSFSNLSKESAHVSNAARSSTIRGRTNMAFGMPTNYATFRRPCLRLH